MSCDPSRTADVSAVIMEEGIYDNIMLIKVMWLKWFIGLAHICLVTQCMTITRAKIELNIPRKRKGACSQHEKVCYDNM